MTTQTHPAPAVARPPDADLYTGTRWAIDPAHSTIAFTVRHMMVAEVTGTFATFEGTLHQGAADFTGSTLAITIATGSVGTNNADRDAHLRSADFFDAAAMPEATFASTAFRRTSEETYAIDGVLTLHGVARPVTLDARFLGRMRDPQGALRAGFTATTAIRRSDFALNWNMVLEAGGVVVSDRVALSIAVQLVWKG